MTHETEPAKRFGRPIIVLVAIIMATVGLLTGLIVMPSRPAAALGPGRVCVFLAPKGALNLGHVGWAFNEPGHGDHWFFGATENPSGLPFVKPGDNNGAWVKDGDWNSVLATFGAKQVNGAQYYTQYRCEDTATSAVGAAVQKANDLKGAGYSVVFNPIWNVGNCMDDAYAVLAAYGAEITLPNSDLVHVTIVPTAWFALLGPNFGPIEAVPPAS